MLSREDIIRMAREAGLGPNAARSEMLARFASIVASAERARACRIVTGLCISDNNAREINEAIIRSPACPNCRGIGYDSSGQLCACQHE